jgi:hypothetical protein
LLQQMQAAKARSRIGPSTYRIACFLRENQVVECRNEGCLQGPLACMRIDLSGIWYRKKTLP